ncbi:uncharacterized protein LOC131233075 isoform X3 [Magnolia sinica]|nr:uncharacterized protein LOC131233075 isoform X3 [Magnolia sinica]XP_058085657.1 uncharacterized protein LOC131233075 isoform X3 [Magnolia sinica]XP_058085658.1 uncharacterized protein LOC131233075 isoform X3 [Magnolia sinica]XP_058085659.1 uncharacterized protein LOC131233075 isoform X3 [Magnolia sinica]
MGGNTRMVVMDRCVSFSTLLLKMSEICNSKPSCVKVKFQFPGTTLDSPLVSVECDEDVRNMMDESDSSNKISLFLFIEQGEEPVVITGEDATLTPAHVSTDSGPSSLLQLADGDQILPHFQELANVQNSGTASSGGEATAADAQIVDGESGPSTPMVRRDQPFAVGQAFADADSFRRALRDYAIANKVALRMVNVCRERVTAKCLGEGCSWRIHASQLRRDLDAFKVKTFRSEHSCGGHSGGRHPQVSSSWVASRIEDWVRDNNDYKPMDIVRDIEREHGVTIKYCVAYKAKWKALKRIYSSDENMMEILNTPRPPGRPKKTCIEKPREVLPLHCGRCNQIGHNRKTCKAPL